MHVDENAVGRDVNTPASNHARYKLVAPKQGAMGIVYMAEQIAPVPRIVALKIISPDVIPLRGETDQFRIRFEAERQMLAGLDHPNIVKLLECGRTDADPNWAPLDPNVDYFTMEWVDGQPIDKHCDESHLALRQRLELFLSVCDAIRYAHSKGIVHRDIKPSNLLVTAAGNPKVIDFGVAKMLDVRHRQLIRGLRTEPGMQIGTLSYCSPEQVNGLTSLDERSDIYSLGVVLYKLLTGTRPFGHRDPFELRKVIQDQFEEASKPSDRLRRWDELSEVEKEWLCCSEERQRRGFGVVPKLADIAALRAPNSETLIADLKGEVDTIVLKCLQKDPARRYQNVRDLIEDIRRYLNCEPVLAVPDLWHYRAKKFCKKNRVWIGVSSMLLVALALTIVALALTIWKWQGEKHQRAIAERQTEIANQQKAIAEQNKDDAQHQKATAEQEKQATEAVLRFVKERVFAPVQPTDFGGEGHDISLLRALENSRHYLTNNFKMQPLLEAELRATLAAAFRNLGKASVAEEEYERAASIYERILGIDDRKTLIAKLNLAVSYLDRSHEDQAIALIERILPIMETALGKDRRETFLAKSYLAIGYSRRGRQQQAMQLQSDLYSKMKVALGPEDPDTLGVGINVANNRFKAKQHFESARLYEELLPLFKKSVGENHVDTLLVLSNLANSLDEIGRHDEAKAYYRSALDRLRKKLPSGHPQTSLTMASFAYCLAMAGEYEESLQLATEALALRRGHLGPQHKDTVSSIFTIACIHARRIRDCTDKHQQSEIAMNWLKQAVAAGHEALEVLRHDPIFDLLRTREDFKQVLAELESKQPKGR